MCKILVNKTFIVTNHDPLSLFVQLEQVTCEPLRAPADIFESVVFCNKTAPTVSPENDLVSHVYSWKMGYEIIISAFNGLNY
jgi:hypothetical protein